MASMPDKPKNQIGTPPHDRSNSPQHQHPTQHNDSMAPVFAHLDAEQAQTYSLVLASAGIPHVLSRQNRRRSISVAHHERGAAQKSISLYLSENQIAPDADAASLPRPARSISALYAALLLTAIHIAVTTSRQQAAFIAAFGADARLIMDGDIYRCITALLLHSDGAHLLANLTGILLFGTLVTGYCGWGVGWILILIAGAHGNALTALWYRTHHISIGASTGVFAALGICAVMAFWRHHKYRTRRRSWLPLAGALALLGWLGTSPRSDLAAHLFGLLSGCGLGGLYLWLFGRPLSWPLQATALLLAVGMALGSCWWGYVKWSL